MNSSTADKVLVINVDNDILDSLIKGLQGQASISFTSNGSKAVDMVRLNKPDLILLDLKKSDVNGFEVCQALKTDPMSQHIPVVFLTRIGGAKNMARALELGAIEYITEPFDLEAVNAKVRNFLAQITTSRVSERAKESSPPVEEQLPERETQGMSLTKFLIIVLIFAALGGGGYAWYTNKLPKGIKDFSVLFDEVLNAVIQTKPAKQEPSRQELASEEELVEEVAQEVTEGDDQQPPKAPLSDGIEEQSVPTLKPSPEPVASIDTCGDIPEVPWWGAASHESIIAYVNYWNDGDWGVYISKWERQLAKLRDIHSKDGTVLTPIERNRLNGTELAEYISKFERRLDVSRCLAERLSTR